MDYDRFTPDRQRAFLTERLHALEADHYANTLNLRVIDKRDNEEEYKRTRDNVRTLERSIDVVKAELAELPEDE